MLLMRFLNRVHFDSAMAPLELEMYHQIKNVIGVNPSFYEVSFVSLFNSLEFVLTTSIDYYFSISLWLMLILL